ncbi:MAG: hypothetical protein ACKODD_03880, partial [Candidatus Nanopelagicus sp.]
MYQRQGRLGTALVSTAAALVVALSLIPLLYLLIRAAQKPVNESIALLVRVKTLEVVGTTALLVLMVVLLT